VSKKDEKMIEDYKKVRITCETAKDVSVDELSRFFYYLNNIYKLTYLQETKKDTKFYNRRKLKDKEKLRISIVRKESPLIFVILTPITIGLLEISKLFIENLKLIRNLNSDRKIKELQVEQLILQNELLKNKIDKSELLKNEINKIGKLKEIKIIIVDEE
jgi:hypothetical protein